MIGENTHRYINHIYIYINRIYKLDLCRVVPSTPKKSGFFLVTKITNFHQPDGPSNMKLWGLAIDGFPVSTGANLSVEWMDSCFGKIQLSSTTHYHGTNKLFIRGYGLDVPVQGIEGKTAFLPCVLEEISQPKIFSTKHHGVKTSLFSLWVISGPKGPVKHTRCQTNSSTLDLMWRSKNSSSHVLEAVETRFVFVRV